MTEKRFTAEPLSEVKNEQLSKEADDDVLKDRLNAALRGLDLRWHCIMASTHYFFFFGTMT